MELKQKKRVIGLVVLVGVILLQLPFLFHRPKTVHHDKISLEIPNPPKAPEIVASGDASMPPSVPVKNKTLAEKTAKDTVKKSTVVGSHHEKAAAKMPQASAHDHEKPHHNSAVSLVNMHHQKQKKKTKTAVSPIKKQATKVAQAWSLQLGVFSSQPNARALIARLRAKGYESYMRATTCGNSKCMIVFVGPELDFSKVKNLKNSIAKNFKLNGIVKKYQI